MSCKLIASLAQFNNAVILHRPPAKSAALVPAGEDEVFIFVCNATKEQHSGPLRFEKWDVRSFSHLIVRRTVFDWGHDTQLVAVATSLSV